jgi:hypothetical protein
MYIAERDYALEMWRLLRSRRQLDKFAAALFFNENSI